MFKSESDQVFGMLARKSVTQTYSPSPRIRFLMAEFRDLANQCIHIGLAGNLTSMKTLSLAAYGQLDHDALNCYRLCAISKAAGILSSRKKSIKRGYPTKDPCVRKAILASCYGFKVVDGNLWIPVGRKQFEQVPLSAHVRRILSSSALKVNSFTLTDKALSLCISKEVQEMKELASIVGVDRNLRNITIGNDQTMSYIDVSKAVRVAKTTRRIKRSFKRNDVRIRRRIYGKYGRRQANRVKQILNHASKMIVEDAYRHKQGIAFENLIYIRSMYQKGNGQSKNHRAKMNSWPFGMLRQMVTYKAAWAGVPVIQLSKRETCGTSKMCPRCGERLLEDTNRTMMCTHCGLHEDRDVIAAINIARRGWVRFAQSKGGVGEAMVQEPRRPEVILKVDTPKLDLLGSQR